MTSSALGTCHVMRTRRCAEGDGRSAHHIDEAFQISTEGHYFTKVMAEIRKRGGIRSIPVEDVPVHTFWDIATATARPSGSCRPWRGRIGPSTTSKGTARIEGVRAAVARQGLPVWDALPAARRTTSA